MLNATRIIAAAAILALGGTLALVGEGLGPSSDPIVVPGAEAPTGDAIAHINGQAVQWVEVDRGEMTVTPAAIQTRGESYTAQAEVDDPRLTGELSTTLNGDAILGVAGTRAVVGTMAIENDRGTWEGTFRGVGYPGTNDIYHQGVLRGTGAYEGLTAVLYMNNAERETAFQIEGAIFPGELPEYP